MIYLNDTHCAPLTHDNFVVNTTDHTVHTVVHVACKDGYRLSGSSELICDNTGSWSSLIPRCIEETTRTPVMIIAVSTVASLVALFVLGCALYMLLKNCKKERKIKKEKEDHDKTMKEVCTYFATPIDCVGMPALVFENMDSTIRGVPESTTSSSQATSTTQGEEEQNSDKLFIY